MILLVPVWMSVSKVFHELPDGFPMKLSLCYQWVHVYYLISSEVNPIQDGGRIQQNGYNPIHLMDNNSNFVW